MTEARQDVLVDIHNVTYTHWNQSEPTLRDVSLQIRRGTLNVLVGPGGSGKSTLCDLFNGVIPHLHGGQLEGKVWVDGVDMRTAEVKELAQKVAAKRGRELVVCDFALSGLLWCCDRFLADAYLADEPLGPDSAMDVVDEYWKWRKARMLEEQRLSCPSLDDLPEALDYLDRLIEALPQQ